MGSAYVYLDESDNLGFDFTKKKTSSWFVVAFLFSREPRKLNKVVRKIFKGFGKLEIKSHRGVRHAFKERPIA